MNILLCNFKGNCLELAANGILNQVYCNDTFEDGCPQDHYFSNEMYKCKYLFKNDKSVWNDLYMKSI